MATKKVIQATASDTPKSLYVYADFELFGKAYQEGELFVPPAGLVPEPRQEEFLNASKVKQGSRVGKVFVYQGEVVNPTARKELQERREHIAVLPVEER